MGETLPRPPLALPEAVAEYLGCTTQKLAQMRYDGTGPAFIKPTERTVRYDWDDVYAWQRANRFTKTNAPAVSTAAASA